MVVVVVEENDDGLGFRVDLRLGFGTEDFGFIPGSGLIVCGYCLRWATWSAIGP